MSAKANKGDRKGSKKTREIPKAYRKPLKKKRFGKIVSMLADSGEKSMVERAFPEGRDGLRRYEAPKDSKKAKEIARILKKVRKARSGPRTFRLVLLAVLIGAPVLFSVFFLDRVAAKQLEKTLESLTGTDAAVEGLDIAPLEARLSIGKLALASVSDPMVDDWVVEDLAADFRWSSLFYRRVVIDEISADFSLRRPRESAAVYPDGVSRDSEDGRKGKGFVLDENLLPEIDVPTASVDLVRDLRAGMEAEYAALTDGFEEDLDEAREIAERVGDFLEGPFPDEKDLAGWTKLLNEGRDLAEDVKAQREVVEDYGNRLERTRRAAEEASDEARRAVEADLAKIKTAVGLDRTALTGWLESAVGSYLGPRAESIFGKIVSLKSGSAGRGAAGKDPDGKKRGRGRMKSGRIVSFPVLLPPRFTIGTLHFSGPGAELNGTNVGIDHDLAGAPSVISLDINEESGLEGRLFAEATADGRSDAELLVEGRLDSSGWRWSSGPGADALGGSVDVSSEFFVASEAPGNFVADGRAVLSEWNGVLRLGSADIVSEESPSLAVGFHLEADRGGPSLRLSLDDGMFAAWSGYLAETLLPFGAEGAEAELLESVDADLAGLGGILEGLDEDGEDLDAVSGLVTSRQDELEEALAEWAKKATGGLDIPGGEGSVEKAAEGLRSLF